MVYMGFTIFMLLICGPWAFCQTDWAVEGSGPMFGEFNSPLCPPYTMPINLFTAPAPMLGCPPLIPFQYSCDLGGSASDNDGNPLSGGPAFPAMLHTDGKTVEMVDAATGAFLGSWNVGGVFLPGPICGLGYDSTADIIWATDGGYFIGLNLPPSCTAPPTVFSGPTPVPLIYGGWATGLDWDPCSGTLWYCDCVGAVVNMTTGGVPISGFLTGPALPAQLMGLTVNTAAVPVAGSSPHLQVTNGTDVAEFTASGVLASTGPFYLASNPFPVPALGAQPVSGLAFSLKPNIYGKPCPSPTGVPRIGWTGGYPFVGNAGFTVTMTGATPGTFAYLVVNIASVCPPLNLPGCPGSVWVAFPWLLTIPIGVVPATGTLSVPAPIPASAVPCGPNVGVPVFCQFINVFPGPVVWETSDALSFTIGDA
jgi:hypothetical protein